MSDPSVISTVLVQSIGGAATPTGLAMWKPDELAASQGRRSALLNTSAPESSGCTDASATLVRRPFECTRCNGGFESFHYPAR